MLPSYKHNFFTTFISILVIFTFNGCKKFLEIPPPATSLNQANVFNSDASATQVLTGFYAGLSDENQNGALANLGALSITGGLLSDELSFYGQPSGMTASLYRNNLDQQSGIPIWANAYLRILRANLALEALNSNELLRPAVKQQLIGEAKFFRAFIFFNLVNLFGDIPMPLGSDPEINRLLPRAPKDQVYIQLIADLQEASSLLGANFLNSNLSVSSERTRPNKWVAKALLARIFLYTNQWEKAEQISTELINENQFELLTDLNSVFLKNSRETIWALQPVRADGSNGYNSGEGSFFVLPANGPNNLRPYYLSKYVVNNFEPGDLRKLRWVDSVVTGGNVYNYPSKYKAGAVQTTVKEYSIVFRIAEQYLIRAEARVHQGPVRFQDAVADLNKLRSRARSSSSFAVPNPLPDISVNSTQSELLSIIERERFSELFTEWGHRWFDLKRLKDYSNSTLSRADEVLPSVLQLKGSTWSPYKQLFPIPLGDIQRNPNMRGQQNPGY